MIIDCHTHLNRYEAAQPARLEDRYRALTAEMERNAVDYALVLTSYRVNDERPGVREVLDVVGDDPRLGVVAGVSHEHGAAELALLRELLGAGRLRGLKLYPGYGAYYVHDRGLRPVYELAAEFRVPVMIHTGDTFDPRARVKYAHPLEVDEVAVEHRDVTFVICHLGNPWLADAMEVIYKNENVVGDVSGLTLGAFKERFERYMLAKVDEVVSYLGDARSLLFGTDWPISDVESYLAFARKLELTDDEREDLLWRNAVRVFGLGPLLGVRAGEVG